MSRRGKAIVKRIVLDPKYNSELVAHMIRVIMKDGKKTVAEKIVYGAIEKIAEKMKDDPSKFVKDEKTFASPLEVVQSAIENMKPQVEVKTRRVGGTTYPVPTPIKENRQLSLALRWTTQYASARVFKERIQPLRANRCIVYQFFGLPRKGGNSTLERFPINHTNIRRTVKIR